MPWILCDPLLPSDKTGDVAGSTAIILTSGFFSFRYSPTPVNVPPVPTPAINTSTLPSVSFQISGPVVSLCAFGLAGLTNCPGMKLFGISLANSSALAMAPDIPLAPSVSTISAPYALRIFLLSTLMVSGIVRIILYPLAAAIEARPIPVFPDVGSMITEPSLRSPFSSASRIIALATLSLTLPDGLKYSSLARIVACSPNDFSTLVISTIGVLPTNSNALL